MAFYIPKKSEVEAIQFEYSDKGIQELKDFCGTALVSFNKDRHIGSTGVATIKHTFCGRNCTDTTFTVLEGDFIVKNALGDFDAYLKNHFFATYEIMPS